MRENDSCKRMA